MTDPDGLPRDGGPPSWLTALAAAVTRDGLPVREEGWPPPPPDARPAAVLILFGRGEHGPDVLLLERAADLRKHAGQPAFPGGGADPADGSAIHTALREAREEVGLDPEGVEILGAAPRLYLPHSNYLVTPVLAWWRVPCPVYPVDPGETSAVARVPVADLVDPANRVRLRHPRTGQPSPAFRVAGMTTVWGFTAGILDALLRLGGLERSWGEGPPVEDPAVNASIARAAAELAQAGGVDAAGEIDPDDLTPDSAEPDGLGAAELSQPGHDVPDRSAVGLAARGPGTAHAGAPAQGDSRPAGGVPPHQPDAPGDRDRTAGTGTGAGPTKGSAA
ncbi:MULTISPECIES: CoA pyrophosphatase [unclassified Pseudofrankia]|uniref:NUDIX hydrolase n=1 Tax=unclassified Pseudofrankia TaxID=2994372 RepID=UPI000A821BC0|nr:MULTISPECIES: CoA pyrophosphatase [unclassified Pseudofrankia]MDT3441758.1 CoA pyrophosphatase [Pseudofrankia sp. BMG5.37]